MTRLVTQIDYNTRSHKVVMREWHGGKLPGDDIITLIRQAATAGDMDEAFWRGFLAAHLGRSSADAKKPGQVQSAARLLCGFGTTPIWTWAKVNGDPGQFPLGVQTFHRTQ